jgi:hypothetical protein
MLNMPASVGEALRVKKREAAAVLLFGLALLNEFLTHHPTAG